MPVNIVRTSRDKVNKVYNPQNNQTGGPQVVSSARDAYRGNGSGASVSGVVSSARNKYLGLDGPKTPLDETNHSIDNMQKRLDFAGAEYDDKETFGKKAISTVGKVLDVIDRPRNAIFNAVEDSVKGENSFGQGFMEGLTGKEHYSGVDAVKDLTGGEAKTGLGKVGQFVGGMGMEMLLDPLNLVTFGAGSLAKGALTGVRATDKVGDVARTAKGLLSNVSDDAMKNVSRSFYKNAEELGTNKRVINAINKLKENGLESYDDLSREVAKMSKGTSILNTDKNLYKSSLTARSATNKHGNLIFENRLSDVISGYGGEANKLLDTALLDRGGSRIKAQELLENAINKTNQLKLTNKNVGGKGFSVAGKSFATNAKLQDKGADFAQAIRKYGEDADGIGGSIARAYSKMQDASGSMLTKFFMKGNPDSAKVFKAMVQHSDSTRNMMDNSTIGSVQKWREGIMAQIKTESPNLNATEALKKLENYEEAMAKYIEIDSFDLINLSETTPEMNKLLVKTADDISKELKSMGAEESYRGLLNEISGNYVPHVKNTDLTNLSRREMNKLIKSGEWSESALRNMGGADTGVYTKNFGIFNQANRKRKYGGDLEFANIIKKIQTSDDGLVENLFRSMPKESMDELKKLGVIKQSDNLLKSDSFRSQFDEAPKAKAILEKYLQENGGAQMLDGIDQYMETSITKAYLVRALQHNKVVAGEDLVRSITNTMGTKLNSTNWNEIKDALNQGMDVVVTKGYIDTVSRETIDALVESPTPALNTLRETLAKMAGSVEAGKPFVSVNPKDMDHLRELFEANRIPLELHAMPKEVVKQYNKIAKAQVDDGFKNLGSLIDTFNRAWKPLVTSIRPDFHTRNYISSNFNDFLDTGVKAFAPKYKAVANKIARTKGKTAGETLMIGGQSFNTSEIYRYMQKEGALSSMERSFYKDSLDKALATEIESSHKSFGKRFRDTAEQGAHYVGNVVEDNVRATNFYINLEKGIKNGLEPAEAMKWASEKVKQFHFDYTDLSEVERKLFRRIMPFYTWSRKNIPLQLEQFLNNPSAFGKIEDITKSSQEAFGVDGQNLPEWAQTNLPVATPFKNKEGEQIMLNGMFPMSDLGRGVDMLTNPIGSTTSESLNMLTPFMKVPMELTLNKSFMNGAPIYKSEYEKNNKMMQHILSQTGGARDISRAVTGQQNADSAYGPAFPDYRTNLGIGQSILKSYDKDPADLSRAFEYLRYISDVKQGEDMKGNYVPTISEIKSTQKNMPYYAK